LVDEIGCLGDLGRGVGERADRLLEAGGRAETAFDRGIEQSSLASMFASDEDVPRLLCRNGGDGIGVLPL
jgi:hypothetical protein